MTIRSTLLGLALVPFLTAACGSSSPSQPSTNPTPVATPTPAPTPTPRPLSVVPPCPLPASAPANPSCTKPNARLADAVNAAIDRVLRERGDLINPADFNGGERILDFDAYMKAVVAALGEAGLCGRIDPEGEISVKQSNTFSEHWIIASHAGYAPPIGNWVKRKYVGACAPATF